MTNLPEQSTERSCELCPWPATRYQPTVRALSGEPERGHERIALCEECSTISLRNAYDLIDTDRLYEEWVKPYTSPQAHDQRLAGPLDGQIVHELGQDLVPGERCWVEQCPYEGTRTAQYLWHAPVPVCAHHEERAKRSLWLKHNRTRQTITSSLMGAVLTWGLWAMGAPTSVLVGFVILIGVPIIHVAVRGPLNMR